MKIARMLYVLSALVVASPTMAAEKSTRDGGSDKVAATASNHDACPGKSDRDGKARCSCTSRHESARPAPVFTDAG